MTYREALNKLLTQGELTVTTPKTNFTIKTVLLVIQNERFNYELGIKLGRQLSQSGKIRTIIMKHFTIY